MGEIICRKRAPGLYARNNCVIDRVSSDLDTIDRGNLDVKNARSDFPTLVPPIIGKRLPNRLFFSGAAQIRLSVGDPSTPLFNYAQGSILANPYGRLLTYETGRAAVLRANF